MFGESRVGGTFWEGLEGPRQKTVEGVAEVLDPDPQKPSGVQQLSQQLVPVPECHQPLLIDMLSAFSSCSRWKGQEHVKILS